jgi:hypothetical protein
VRFKERTLIPSTKKNALHCSFVFSFSNCFILDCCRKHYHLLLLMKLDVAAFGPSKELFSGTLYWITLGTFKETTGGSLRAQKQMLSVSAAFGSLSGDCAALH